MGSRQAQPPAKGTQRDPKLRDLATSLSSGKSQDQGRAPSQVAMGLRWRRGAG